MGNPNRVKRESFTTPKGIASWPQLNEPDTKFDPNGAYTVKMRYEKADPLVIALIANLDRAHSDSVAAFALEKKQPKIKQADKPFKDELDDDGNETGFIRVNFKLAAKVERKDGTFYEQRPVIYDSQGTPSKALIYGGSTLKVAFEIIPFFTTLVGAGISLRLKAVQIIELRTKGDRSAESFGFGKEDGYAETLAETAQQEQFGATDVACNPMVTDAPQAKGEF